MKSRSIRQATLFVALLALLSGCGVSKHYAAGRSYWMHEPDTGFNPSAPNAVVLVLHGWGDSGPAAARMTGFNDLADAHGFVAVYPEGRDSLLMPRSWNAGLCCNSAVSRGTDDVAYLHNVLADLRSDQGINIDPQRIYVAGFSNGGMMALRFAALASDTVAAVGAVAGAIPASGASPTTEPVSLVTYHGTDDAAVAFGGGSSVMSGGPPYASAADLIAQWRSWSGCNDGPVASVTGNVNEQTWTRASGHAVRQGVITGGNHAWPGGRAVSLTGEAPNSSFPASAKMWEFFEQHPKP